MIISNSTIKLSETSSTTLDLIRVIAIQNITIVHGIAMMRIKIPVNAGLIGSLTFPFLFLLSGFLISYSIFNKIKREDYNFSRFFLNRVCRILPPLLVGLLMTAFIDGVYAVLRGFKIPSETYNVPTYFLNLLFLNDSAFGVPNFGTSFQLWTLPKFFWMYLCFGWIVLGKRSTNRTYFYFLILAFLTFMAIMIYCGPWYRGGFRGNIALLFTWFCGIIIALILDKLQLPYKKKDLSSVNQIHSEDSAPLIRKESFENSKYQFNSFLKLKPNLFLYCALFLFTFCVIGPFLYRVLIEFILLLILSFFFILIFSQNTSYKYPEKTKRFISFLANYSYSLYILHYSIYNFLSLFWNSMNNIILFFIGYLLCNLLSIGLSFLTERRYQKIYAFLLKKFI
jgi:peptidoglycan/LPS O-acetylase OafA/YrhL